MNKLSSTLLRAGVLALGLAAAAGASAQSAVAAISGKAQPTDTIVIQNVNTGFTREIKPKADGRYVQRNLPTGTFSVVIKHADGSVDQPRVLTLRVGQTARVL